MICDHNMCDTEINHMVSDHITAHSMVAVLQYVDKDGYKFNQCEGGQERKFVNYQHYHCSHSHMQQSMLICLVTHYNESLLHPIAPGSGSTILHKIVLGSKIQCKVCLVPIEVKAYRFCLTLCTPVNVVPDHSQDELGEWCCSLEHALQSALEIIDNLQEVELIKE